MSLRVLCICVCRIGSQQLAAESMALHLKVHKLAESIGNIKYTKGE